MSRSNILAIFLSLFGVLIAYLVADQVFEKIPHIEDEVAYVWQARVIASGQITIPAPAHSDSFLVPFVVEANGRRFSKYPLGWPVLLAIGVVLGVRSLVNPLLAGLGVWLTYRLGQKIFGDSVGLLAAGLTLTSPFFMMNSGSLLSHPFGLVLSAAFALAWLDVLGPPLPSPHVVGWRGWLPVLVAGFSLGVLALTRPLTAVGVGLPFGLYGLYLLVKADRLTRLRLLTVGLIAIGLGALIFVWQYAVTGDPLLNPYTLWWPYDRVGFGPGIGTSAQGHNLTIAWENTVFSLWHGYRDLFGWGAYSWIFLPFSLLAVVKIPWRGRTWQINGRALLVGSVFLGLVLVYMAYWVGAGLYGPRYYYEGLFSLTIFSAAGIVFLAGGPLVPGEGWHLTGSLGRLRWLGIALVVSGLVAYNLAVSTPERLGGMYQLYGISTSRSKPFTSPEAQSYTPALIIVHAKKWTEYGALLELEDPELTSPFIFALDRGPEVNQEVIEEYPGRQVFYYYPDEPYVFYTAPRPGS